MNLDALKQKLKEIRDFLNALKDEGVEAENIERILAEIDELLEFLEAGREIDQILHSFRLMRMLIEKLKGIAEKVPMLDKFLELYLAALESTEIFIEITLAKYSFTGRVCDLYYRYRLAKEQQLKDADPDADDVDAQSHAFAWARVKDFTQEKYEDELKLQYQGRRRRDFVQEEKKKTEEDVSDIDDDSDGPEPDNGAGTAPDTGVSSIDTIDFLLVILKRIWSIEDRLKDPDISEEERRRLEAERDALWRLVQFIIR